MDFESPESVDFFHFRSNAVKVKKGGKIPQFVVTLTFYLNF